MSTMDGNSQKTPFAQSLQRIAQAKATDSVQTKGKNLPCTVTEVISPGIVRVSFDVDATPATLPQVIMPVGKPPYIQYPIQVGDAGVAMSADVRLGALTGLGGGTPNLQDAVGNLAAMTFFWLGKKSEVFIDTQGTTLLEPTGNTYLSTSAPGVTVEGNEYVSLNLSVGTGATGNFTSVDGFVITVANGIIINIS